MRRFIDLSHTVTHGLVTYPGLPAPAITDFLSREASQGKYAPGTTFHIARIDMVANTGTYLDAPSHRWSDGADLSALPLESLADLAGVTVRAGALRRIDASLFQGVEIRDRAVLIHTGWSRHWGSEAYFSGHPFLTRDASEFLRDGGAKIVGIDTLNIDDTADGERPAHSVLLRAGIPIIEHMTALDEVPNRNYRLFAVPVKVEGMGTFPVRAFAVLSS